MISTSGADITASSLTFVNSASFLFIALGKGLSALQRRISGCIPIALSSLTECCDGFVFSSPAAAT